MEPDEFNLYRVQYETKGNRIGPSISKAKGPGEDQIPDPRTPIREGHVDLPTRIVDSKGIVLTTHLTQLEDMEEHSVLVDEQIRIVQNVDKEAFERETNELLADGWKIHGAVQFILTNAHPATILYIVALTKGPGLPSALPGI